MTSTTVVFDVNVLTDAVGANKAEVWSEELALLEGRMKGRGSYSRMALHMIRMSAATTKNYNLVSDDHIQSHVHHWLSENVENDGYGWSEDAATGYAEWLGNLADSSGGEAYFERDKELSNAELTQVVPDKVWKDAGADVDHEDRRIVALARDSGASIIVTNDRNFLKLRNRIKYVSIMDPTEFVQLAVGYRD